MIHLIEKKREWESLIAGYSHPTFLQSWNWGETHKDLGHHVWRIKLSRGCAQIIKESAKRATYLTCPGGPLIPWDNADLNEFTQTMINLGKQEKALFLRIRPQIIASHEAEALIHSLSYLPSPVHLHAQNTWQLDLTQSEEQLLLQMRKTTRQLVRKAQTLGLNVRQNCNPGAVTTLHALQCETAKRQKFVPFSRDYLESHLRNFLPDDQITIFEGVYDDRIIASAMIIFYRDEAIYHYSGSSSSAKDVPINYLLQYHAILEAKKRGCKRYNFWGIAPKRETNHRFSGVTTFKTGFGGYQVDYLRAHDLPLSPMYYPVRAFELLRSYHRHLVI